ncbi:hypothetical protein BU26DRAFT_546858 [Trematosphaeria pertusa]|uniref:Uncharacterized protein n=1 Tax=Trematosphaeria pertusa TaxID=390896 RepID=A0A6A6IXE4_9PLEO|nr:uncharacterized protein BU26DRAFT_546858 [Trematosphaeria pertusa]KAF2254697.1 hypothetical protein BU26DRAFT_546858 [Trematosphaeria pertusa]
MHFSTFLLPLTLAITAVSEPLAEPKALPAGIKYAAQFRREPTQLMRRLDVDPELVCGDNYNDCGNGFCCSSSAQCAGEIYDIPVCKDPTVTDGPFQGTAAATPYKDVEGVLSSLGSVLAEITAGNIPTQFGGASTATGSVQGGQETGGAGLAGPAAFGKTAGVVAAIWGVAALGGAGWLLL